MDEPSSFHDLLSMFAGDKRKEIQKAYVFSEEHLSSVPRRDGLDYFVHGYEVASTLQESVRDASLVKVALLHDILAHGDGEELLRKAPLQQGERAMVRSMFDLRHLHIDQNTRDLDKFVSAISEEERLLPLRMAHRLNDVKHLSRFHSELQNKIAHESLYMYAAIAGRLGMHKWRYEMEDICFSLLHPKMAQRLRMKFQEYDDLDRVCLDHASAFLQKVIRGARISAIVERRLKSLYSTYRKMLLKRRKFEELTDRLAIRIVTKSLDDCYRCLGLVHSHMNPIPGKLKDYIGAPKENGYRSIHTVVYPLPGITEQPIEIQIRTEEMHDICEFGEAAHEEYKNKRYSLRTGRARVDLMKNFQILRMKGRSPSQFARTLRKYFDENQIAVFDEKNNLYHLERPSTILDFLCVAYPQKLERLGKILLNGRIAALDNQLRDGDVVNARYGKRRTIEGRWANACLRGENAKLIRKIAQTGW